MVADATPCSSPKSPSQRVIMCARRSDAGLRGGQLARIDLLLSPRVVDRELRRRVGGDPVGAAVAGPRHTNLAIVDHRGHGRARRCGTSRYRHPAQLANLFVSSSDGLRQRDAGEHRSADQVGSQLCGDLRRGARRHAVADDRHRPHAIGPDLDPDEQRVVVALMDEPAIGHSRSRPGVGLLVIVRPVTRLGNGDAAAFTEFVVGEDLLSARGTNQVEVGTHRMLRGRIELARSTSAMRSRRVGACCARDR